MKVTQILAAKGGTLYTVNPDTPLSEALHNMAGWA
jgi:hypothetical protein